MNDAFGKMSEEKVTDKEISTAAKLVRAMLEATEDADDALNEYIGEVRKRRDNFIYNVDAFLAALTEEKPLDGTDEKRQ